MTVTLTRLVSTLALAALLAPGAGRICVAQSVENQWSYEPPPKAIELTADAVATLAAAKSVALVAIDVARMKLVSYDEKNKRAVVALPGGIRRAVSAEKAKSELVESMREWNRFAIVDAPEQADIVVVVFEDTVEPSRLTRSTGDRKHRLRERLAVFAAGHPDRPLWAGEERESTFGALTGSPVAKVVDKFRDELDRRTRANRE